MPLGREAKGPALDVDHLLQTLQKSKGEVKPCHSCLLPPLGGFCGLKPVGSAASYGKGLKRFWADLVKGKASKVVAKPVGCPCTCAGKCGQALGVAGTALQAIA